MQLPPEDQMGLGPRASQALAVSGDSAAEPGAGSSSLQPLCLGASLRLWLANSGSQKSPKLFPFLEENL